MNDTGVEIYAIDIRPVHEAIHDYMVAIWPEYAYSNRCATPYMLKDPVVEVADKLVKWFVAETVVSVATTKTELSNHHSVHSVVVEMDTKYQRSNNFPSLEIAGMLEHVGTMATIHLLAVHCPNLDNEAYELKSFEFKTRNLLVCTIRRKHSQIGSSVPLLASPEPFSLVSPYQRRY